MSKRSPAEKESCAGLFAGGLLGMILAVILVCLAVNNIEERVEIGTLKAEKHVWQEEQWKERTVKFNMSASIDELQARNRVLSCALLDTTNPSAEKKLGLECHAPVTVTQKDSFPTTGYAGIGCVVWAPQGSE